MEDNLRGYKEKSMELLRGEEITVGDTVTIKTSEKEITGILMPRYESADKNHIVIKLKSGYNIGIRTDQIQSIAKIEDSFKQLSKEYKINQSIKSKSKAHPKIALIGTGGTIASKVDYRTGGVSAALFGIRDICFCTRTCKLCLRRA